MNEGKWIEQPQWIVNEWTVEWVTECLFKSESVKWMSELMVLRMNEWILNLTQRASEWKVQWMDERWSERTRYRSEWMSEWMSEWLNVMVKWIVFHFHSRDETKETSVSGSSLKRLTDSSGLLVKLLVHVRRLDSIQKISSTNTLRHF